MMLAAVFSCVNEMDLQPQLQAPLKEEGIQDKRMDDSNSVGAPILQGAVYLPELLDSHRKNQPSLSEIKILRSWVIEQQVLTPPDSSGNICSGHSRHELLLILLDSLESN